MKITLGDEARQWIEETYKEWRAIRDEYYEHMDDYKNWKRSPTLREDRRESIVYGNLSGMLRMILNVANNPELFEGDEDETA